MCIRDRITNSGTAVTFADDDQLRFVYNGTTVQDLEDMISAANGTSAYTYLQYDFRSFNGGKNDNNYYLNFTVGDSTIDSFAGAKGSSYDNGLDSFFNTGLVGTALMNSPATKATGFGSLTGTDALAVTVEINLISGSGGDALSAGNSYPLTMDFVTYGQSNDGVEQGLSLIHI